MPLPEDPAAFEAAFRAAVAAILPSATVELARRTIVMIKMRVELGADRFTDVFFNARNHRTDLTVIERGRRVLGYDNLGGWHRHPPQSPDAHEECEEPSLEAFVREAVSLTGTTNG